MEGEARTSLIGRASECERIDQVLIGIAEGRSGLLVMRGEPGIGKTALLKYAEASLGDAHVARVAGVDSEMEFAFAALHQLLRPFLHRLDVLPEPQRAALACAFGLEAADEPPNQFLIALATLSLLADAATQQPLLCIIDDAQWIDDESVRTLGAVARRLQADRIGMLFATRTMATQTALDGLPDLHIGGLDDEEARQLVVTAKAELPPTGIVDRIVRECAGNPLGLRTFASDMVDAGTITSNPIEPLPISRRLEERFLQQVLALPAPARSMLLAVAADPSADEQMLWLAGESLGFGAEVIDLPGVRDLVDLGPPVAFHHPLMRSAVYHGSSVEARARTHEVLAAATAATDHDRRAWHLAAAATRPDERVAAELEAAADRALERGGAAAAAACLSRSAELTADPSARASRLVRAAQTEWVAGHHSEALRLAQEAASESVDPVILARVRRIVGWSDSIRATSPETWMEVLDQARSPDDSDVRYLRSVLLDAMASNSGDHDALVRFAGIGMATPRPPDGAPAIDDLLLDGLCLWFAGHEGDAAPLLRRALRRIDLGDDGPIGAHSILLAGCMAAAALGDLEPLYEWAVRLERFGRDLGAPLTIFVGQMFLAIADLGAGDISSYVRRLDVDDGSVRGVFPPEVFAGDVAIPAWRGDEQRARSVAESQVTFMDQLGRREMLPYVDYSISVLDLSLGNYAEALERLIGAVEPAYQFRDLVLADLVEAACRCDERSAAMEAAARLADRADSSRNARRSGLAARARALIADDATAEGWYRESIAQLETTDAPCHLARTKLVYGEWLRRQQRKLDARAELREARELFLAMGAGGFAERARRELAACGERIRPTSTMPTDDLTPQEELVAHLAAGGDTNVEIAARMFLSPATVDYHLRKVYRKLGISSRRQLTGVLITGQDS